MFTSGEVSGSGRYSQLSNLKSHPRPRPLACLLNYLNHAPAFARGQRSRLDYSHDVAYMSAYLVMRHELGSLANIPFVFRVTHLAFDANDYRLRHLVAGNKPDLFLPTALWRTCARLGFRARLRLAASCRIGQQAFALLILTAIFGRIVLYVLFHTQPFNLSAF